MYLFSVGKSDRGCTDNCSKERGEAHLDTIFNVVRQNRLHPREKSILLEMDRERVTTHIEEEAHFTQTQFTQTQLSLLSHTAAQGSRAAALGSYSLFLFSRISLLFSSTLSYSFALSRMPINRQVWWLLFFKKQQLHMG